MTDPTDMIHTDAYLAKFQDLPKHKRDFFNQHPKQAANFALQVAAEEIMHTYYSEGEHRFLQRVETTFYFTNDRGTVFIDMTDPANPVHNYAS